MPRDSEPLVDSTLDRELEALLAAQPSPDFNARVRSAVGHVIVTPWWLPRRAWLLAPAGALVGVALVMTLVTHSRFTAPTTLALTGRPFVSPLAGPPQVTAMPVTRTAPASASAGSRPRPAGRHGHGSPTELVVLVAPDESRALGRFLARSRPMHLASATDDRPLPLSADAPAPVRPLDVPLLAIEPLASPDDLPGGVCP
jgi:hypothetical protein